MQENQTGKESDRQAQLAERLNIADVLDVLHCKQNQCISAGTANSRDNRINNIFIPQLFQRFTLSFAKNNQRNFSECQAHLNQKQIAQCSGVGNFSILNNLFQCFAVAQCITGCSKRAKQNKKQRNGIQSFERDIFE